MSWTFRLELLKNLPLHPTPSIFSHLPCIRSAFAHPSTDTTIVHHPLACKGPSQTADQTHTHVFQTTVRIILIVQVRTPRTWQLGIPQPTQRVTSTVSAESASSTNFEVRSVGRMVLGGWKVMRVVTRVSVKDRRGPSTGLLIVKLQPL